MAIDAFFENISDEIKAHLQGATKSIRVAVAYFTDQQIFSFLCSRARQGINVELIISAEDSNFKAGTINFDNLVDSGGHLYISLNEETGTLHDKFLIIDDNIVLTGSYNLSYKARRNLENIVMMEGHPELAQKFIDEFERIKNLSVKRQVNHKTFLLQTGMGVFDEAFGGFYSGSVIVFGSRPQTGRTALLLTLVRSILQSENNTVAFLSLSDSEQVIAQKLLSITSGLPIDSVKNGSLDVHETGKLYMGGIRLSNKKNLLLMELFRPSANELLQTLREELRFRNDLKLVIIEDIHRLSETYGIRDFRDIESTFINIKRLARELNVPVICSVAIKEEKGRPLRELTGADFGILEDHADTIFTLYKPEYYTISLDRTPDFKVKSLKNRHGSLNSISLTQNSITKEFVENDFEQEMEMGPGEGNIFFSNRQDPFESTDEMPF